MEDVGLIVDIVLALGSATIGGLIAQRLGLPALIGYVLAGLAIGPNTPGLVADQGRLVLLANLGVALLMFGLGVVQDFSLAPMLALIPVIAGERAGPGGIVQSLLISAAVLTAAFLLGTR